MTFTTCVMMLRCPSPQTTCSDNVDLVGDPVLDNPTTARWFNTCTLTTTGVRQTCASASEQPAFQIRAENALDTTGARLEGVMQDDPFYVDFSFFKNVWQPGQLPVPGRDVQRHQRRSVGHAQHDGHQRRVRVDHREPGQRSGGRCSCVLHYLLTAGDRGSRVNRATRSGGATRKRGSDRTCSRTGWP